MKSLAFAALVLATGCTINAAHTQYRADDTPTVKTVIFDEGGYFDNRAREIKKLNEVGARIEIRGVCISSCTMYLGADNVCVAPNARLGFHGATETFFIPATPENKLRYDTNIARYYPPNLRGWFWKEARHIIIAWKSKTGQEVHDMDPDRVPLCK